MKKRYLLGLSVICIAGCTPLQQAPLVYSSRLTVGVDLTAQTTENPGIAINLGVKSVDSAYVPVAVSKKLEDNSSGSQQKAFAIEKLYAEFGHDTNGKTKSELSDQNQRLVSDYLKAKAAESDAAQQEAILESQRKTELTAIANLEELKKRVNAAKAASQVDAAAQASVANEMQSINQLANINGLAAISSSVNPAGVPVYDSAALEQSVQEAQRQHEITADNLQQRAEAVAKTKAASAQSAAKLYDAAVAAAELVQTKKRDAYSVYGRFDSKSGGEQDGEKTSANILVGKVFSTGLASQNLTEAVKISASSQCISQLIELVKQTQNKVDNATLANMSLACLDQTKKAQ